jgi:hypothetical protein
MRPARPAGRAFSPLDEELGLLPGALTPTLAEGLVRLGAEVPSFARAAALFAYFTGAAAPETSARRRTEAAGAAYVAVQAAELARLEREAPAGPAGPPLLQLSVDGAMVPLVGGQWAEVKTLAVGVVGQRLTREGVRAAATGELSYFSRLADAGSFARAATVETHRRGVAAAGRVVAPADGSEWCQGFYDYHRPDAVRILDFPHAAGHLAGAGQAAFGAGTPAAATWLAAQRRTLKRGDPADALAAVLTLPAASAPDPAAAAAARDATFEYLARRWGQIQYAEFVAAGYPVGSGAVESANKPVVEDRLKGPGMHWARAHVDPMLALRNVACADRWAEAWPQIEAELRRAAAARSADLRARRQADRARPGPAVAMPPPEVAAPEPALAPPPAPPRPKKVVNGIPTADHPWRRRFLPERRAS